MRLWKQILGLFLTVWFTAAASVPVSAGNEGPAARVTVYAAASLTNALQEVAGLLEAAEPIRLRFSFAGSSSLARQIEQGAAADLFVAANGRWMDHLEEQGLVLSATRVDLITNRLVVVAPGDEGFPVRTEPDFDFAGAFEGRLAVADPDHVPAGVYGRQALTALGWWGRVAGRLAPAMDVRGALAYVERGACPAGIVYATDAAASRRVAVLAEIPSWTHDPIVYPAAVVSGRTGPAPRSVLAFLRSDAASEVFRRHGFGTPEPEETNVPVER